MEWLATKHALLVHLPVAVGFLLPLALFAAQRPGRGIRPWWTACRYLGWAGLLGLIAALLSGWCQARVLGLLPAGRLIPWPGGATVLQRHVLGAVASLPLALLALWAMHRPRKEHQGLGVLALFLGLCWAAVLIITGRSGHSMAQAIAKPIHAMASLAPVKAVAAPPVDPEAQVPLRALDYTALQPIQAEPVKSLAHGGRWIRVWVGDAAAGAYRAGGPLPAGTLVVMSSVEDRWGRPGPEPGPLYALEMKGGRPRLTFYWPRVPADRLAEAAGQTHVYWRSPDPHLEACLVCHAGGLADPATRSRWKIPYGPKAGTALALPGPSASPAGAAKKKAGAAPGSAPAPESSKPSR